MTSGGCGSSPGCAPTWCTTDPVLGAAGEAAGAGADQDLRGRLHPGHRHCPGDDRGADRRAAQPGALADLAIGRCGAKRAELAAALDGRLEDHHSDLARILLDQIAALTTGRSTS